MVDLIPADYRRARQLQRLLLRFVVACAVLMCAVLAARAALEYVLRTERADSAAASSQTSRAAAVRGRAAELERQKQAAEQTLAALRQLHGGASMDAMFVAIDQAYDERIWFRELAYAREPDAGRADPPGAPDSRATPAGGAAAAAAAAGPSIVAPRMVSERVQIRGNALDHTALAEFIRQLQGRHGVAAVRLHDTSVRGYSSAQVVDFQLELSLGKLSEASR